MAQLSKKDKYRIFCQEELLLPIFMQDWWLDAVCIDGQWDICIVEADNKIIAAWPYYLTKKANVVQVTMPLFTKFAGPWFKYPEGQKEINKLTWEKDIITELLNQMPKVVRFRQNFNYYFTNWLPLYWKGYSQTTYYSYRLENISSSKEIREGFKSSVKNKLAKAEQNLNVKLNDDFVTLKSLFKKTANSKNLIAHFPEKLLDNIHQACNEKNCSITISALTKEDVPIASIYLVWDSTTVYYLVSGMDNEYKNLSANTLLIWEAIKFTSQKGLVFDFEGSMIEVVEHFFRSFGAVQKPYFFISKTDSKLVRFLEFLKLV